MTDMGGIPRSTRRVEPREGNVRQDPLRDKSGDSASRDISYTSALNGLVAVSDHPTGPTAGTITRLIV